MISSYLTQTATITPTSSYDKYGVPIVGTAVGVDCRVEEKTRYVRNKDMQQEISTATAFLNPSVSVDIDYQFLFDGKTYEVLEVKNLRTWGSSIQHKEVMLK